MIPVANAFLKEAPPRQLGALAASLARIASSATKPARTAAIDPMLSECIQFVEWTTPQASSKVAAEIADLRAMLMLWRDSWPHAQQNENLRSLLSFQAKKWSDQIVGYSGLLDSN